MLTREGQWGNALALALEQRLSPEDVHLATMPLYHVGGRALVLSHTLRGCTVHLHDAFDADAVAADIERHRVTTTQVVPTMIAWLLDAAPRDLSSLRLIWYASAPMPVELLRRGLERFGPIFVQGYGQTESGPLATVLTPAEHDPEAEHLASAGRAVPGVEVRIDDGEILIRSPFNMTGYWRNPELTAEALRDGWLHTGDLGRLDERGYLYIVDRKKDLIISGGENIYPREVEEVLYAHPAVREAAVIGVPDETWGESVKAVVVPAGELAPDELIAFCRSRLARYKCPKVVELRAELPKTPSGKVLKRELRT
jgi:acyl-CoA synthetase (AMP-forming)/AMP-acid ligase II